MISCTLTACSTERFDETEETSTVESELAYGTVEDNYKFPWLVRVTGQGTCHGTLLGRHWVLTAAHCVVDQNGEILPNVDVRYGRTSPTGIVTSGWQYEGITVRIHPDYVPIGDFGYEPSEYDLALVQMRDPLDEANPDPYLQPAHLPSSPPYAGLSGTIASTIDHTGGPLPTDSVAVWTSAVTSVEDPIAVLRVPSPSLCSGDSGGGFVTASNVVAGVASFGPVECLFQGIDSGLASVYHGLDWISDTTKLLHDLRGTGDFNGDGKTDILWRNGNGAVAIWFMNNIQKTQAFVTDQGAMVHPGMEWQIQATGYFKHAFINTDAKSDILWRHNDGTLSIWHMNGAEVDTKVQINGVGNDWKVVGTGDFNNDQRSDILWRHDGGQVAIWLMNSCDAWPLGCSWSDVYPGGSGNNDWKIQGTADFNNDHKTDILWRHVNGQVAIWLMNGAVYGDIYPGGPGPQEWQIQGTGDFNNDDKADILWRHTNGQVAIWLMNGSAYADVYPGYPYAPGLDWQIEGTGNFNNSGNDEILWRNVDHTVAIWFMNGGTITAQTYPFAP